MKPFPRRLLYLLAPGLLVVVACMQMTLVRTHHLTAWKGGGFGMFSTFDSPSARTLRLMLLTPEGDALVLVPQLNVQQSRLTNMPNIGLLTDLAAQTARGNWVIYTHDQLNAIDGLPEEIQRQLARADFKRRKALEADSTAVLPAPYPELIAFPAARRPIRVEGREAEILGARAEVWHLQYDAAENQIETELMNEATFTSR